MHTRPENLEHMLYKDESKVVPLMAYGVGRFRLIALVAEISHGALTFVLSTSWCPHRVDGARACAGGHGALIGRMVACGMPAPTTASSGSCVPARLGWAPQHAPVARPGLDGELAHGDGVSAGPDGDDAIRHGNLVVDTSVGCWLLGCRRGKI